MPSFTTTAKHALRRLTGSNVISDIDAGFAALADDLDAIIARADQGAANSRPTSTPGTPGIFGRWYWDTSVLSFDYGTGWIIVYRLDDYREVGLDGGATVLRSGWGVPGDGTRPVYWREGATVHIDGMINRTPTAGDEMFVLPTGFRPSKKHQFLCAKTAVSASTITSVVVEVNTNGSVDMYGNLGAATAGYWLDGISFRAA